jgi:hypothetical protein
MPDPNTPPDPNTRESLHAVAEFLLAGPQFEHSGTIKLRVTPGGFGTSATPDVRVVSTSLHVGEKVLPIDGRTIASLATEAELTARSLNDVYLDSVAATADDVLHVVPEHAAEIAEAFERGHRALVAFVPESEPVLWPEHFDLGISVDEVNYGISPGDGHLGVPYAYVGPWGFAQRDLSNDSAEPSDPFWNAPFGSARPLSEISDLEAYFRQGKQLTP